MDVCSVNIEPKALLISALGGTETVTLKQTLESLWIFTFLLFVSIPVFSSEFSCRQTCIGVQKYCSQTSAEHSWCRLTLSECEYDCKARQLVSGVESVVPSIANCENNQQNSEYTMDLKASKDKKIEELF